MGREASDAINTVCIEKLVVVKGCDSIHRLRLQFVVCGSSAVEREGALFLRK
jgi:hypothetical protein